MFFKKKTESAPVLQNDILKCGECKDCEAMKGRLYCKQSLREVQMGERKAIITVARDTECYYVRQMRGMN